MTDVEREHLIESYRQILVDDLDPEIKRIAALRMAELISARSPEQVVRVEVERGLRAP